MENAPSAFDRILAGIDGRPDFPASPGALRRIDRLADSEGENVLALASEVLKDVALTQRALRLANSPQVSPALSGTIQTVSHAIMVLGIDTIRTLTGSLEGFERITDPVHADNLRLEFLRAYVRGTIARDLCGGLPILSEEAFVSAAFHRLARMVTLYHEPELAEGIETRRLAGWPEDAASRRLLGAPYDDLAQRVATRWSFPASLVAAMRSIPDRIAVQRPATKEGAMRVLASLAHCLCSIAEELPIEQQPVAIARATRRYGPALGTGERAMRDALGIAGFKLRELGPADDPALVSRPLTVALTHWAGAAENV